MSPVAQIKAYEASGQFDIKLLINHDAPKGIPLTTTYRVNKHYPYPYEATLRHYLEFVFAMINHNEARRYAYGKENINKNLAIKEIEAHRLANRRILRDALAKKLAKKTSRLHV